MFLGHLGAGLAAKRAVPRVSLGTWFLSVQFLDLLWPVCLLLGLEHVRIEKGTGRLTPLDFEDYPITHSLVAAVGWGLAFGLVHFAFRRRAGTALLLALGVVSHWVLDLVVHRPDLPILPRGGPRVGLGLWDVPAVAVGLELTMYGGGAWLYLRATRARDRVGSWGIAILLLFLLASFLASVFGPPPPDERALAVTSLAGWVVGALTYWVDHHRAPVLG